jgi:hypothetical protein
MRPAYAIDHVSRKKEEKQRGERINKTWLDSSLALVQGKALKL